MYANMSLSEHLNREGGGSGDRNRTAWKITEADPNLFFFDESVCVWRGNTSGKERVRGGVTVFRDSMSAPFKNPLESASGGLVHRAALGLPRN